MGPVNIDRGAEPISIEPLSLHGRSMAVAASAVLLKVRASSQRLSSRWS
jgi:hypothetical protein